MKIRPKKKCDEWSWHELMDRLWSIETIYENIVFNTDLHDELWNSDPEFKRLSQNYTKALGELYQYIGRKRYEKYCNNI